MRDTLPRLVSRLERRRCRSHTTRPRVAKRHTVCSPTIPLCYHGLGLSQRKVSIRGGRLTRVLPLTLASSESLIDSFTILFMLHSYILDFQTMQAANPSPHRNSAATATSRKLLVTCVPRPSFIPRIWTAGATYIYTFGKGHGRKRGPQAGSQAGSQASSLVSKSWLTSSAPSPPGCRAYPRRPPASSAGSPS